MLIIPDKVVDIAGRISVNMDDEQKVGQAAVYMPYLRVRLHDCPACS